MTEKIVTAYITQVKLGVLELEGLMLNEKTFAISIPQANDVISFSTSNNVASRDLKRILGEDFSPSKVKVEGLKQLINCILLIDFERVLFRLAMKGNPKAVEISEMLIGLSLHQLFSDAFHIKFEAEDRQDWLLNRQATKQSFWWMAGEIKQYLDSRIEPSSNPTSHYTNAFKAMSVGLFGKAPKLIKEELGLGKNDLNRDHFGVESLRRIDQIQRLAKANILRGSRPMEAVQEAVETMNFEVIDYKL
jgi:hypothetical protein